jgi:hypothetical protein
MHYGNDSFSSNGKPTLLPIKSGVTIGQRDGLSSQDAAEIRTVYSGGNDKSMLISLKLTLFSLLCWALFK